jgi:hypothetical protein
MKYVIGNRACYEKNAEVSDALDEAHTIAWSGQIEEGETIFIFSNEDDLLAWARSAPALIAEQIERTRELARAAQELENTENKLEVFRQSLLIKQVMSEIQSLADRLGLDPRSEELLKIAFDGDPDLEPSVPRSAILFAHALEVDEEIRCVGAWRPIPAGVAIPNLSWIRFDGRATSVRADGALTLAKHPWFRGPSVFLSGWQLSCLPLAKVNFENAASSAISV